MDLMEGGTRAQIAIEFIVVYSFVLVIFVFLFALVVNQRAATLNEQDYSYLQLVAQSISQTLNQALAAGNGYNTTILITEPAGASPYNIIITSTGIVIVNQTLGSQVISAESFSGVRNLIINGTALLGSSNNIILYSVQTYSGGVSVYNQQGTIYVDEKPFPTGTQLGNIWFGNPKITEYASFNNVNYIYATLPGNAPIDYASSYTLTAWVASNAIATNAVVYSEGNTLLGNSYKLSLSQNYGMSINVTNQLYGEVYQTNPPTNAPMGPWVFIGVSCSGCGYQTGTYNFYLDNLSQTGVGIQGENNLGTNEIGVGVNVGSVYSGMASSLSPGLGITNLQIYNASLSTAQIAGLYKEGINGAPINIGNVSLWYKLNGDTLDYSGFGNSATPYLARFRTVAQLEVLGSTFGNSYSLSPFGQYFAGAYSTAGVLSSVAIFNPGPRPATTPANGYSYSDENAITFSFNNNTAGDPPGQATIFLDSNGTTNAITVTAVGFNGNLTTVSNLTGWWPLNEGTGNIIHDLSGGYNFGTASNLAWSKSVNSTSLSPAKFPGTSSSSNYATISQISAYNALLQNDSFTVVTWINEAGPGSGGTSAIFGDGGNDRTGPADGFAVLANDPSECNIMYVNQKALGSLGLCTIPLLTTGNWVMITAEYNGQSGIAAAYLNQTLVSESDLSPGLLIGGTNSFTIGSTPWSAGTGVFNGMITNVQLYSTSLNQTQINYLVGEGISGAPLDNAGLVGWWPLDGSGSDFSKNNNPASVGSGVAFQNTAVSLAKQVNQSAFPVFSPAASSYVSIPNAASLKLSSVTFGGWVRYNGPATSASGAKFNWLMAKYGAYGVGTCGTKLQLCFHDWSDSANTIFSYSLNPGQWYMVMATVGSGVEIVYVNGVAIGYNTLTISSQSTGWKIGYSGTGSEYMNGSVLDAQVYNGVLSTTQIQQLYSAGLPPTARITIPV